MAMESSRRVMTIRCATGRQRRVCAAWPGRERRRPGGGGFLRACACRCRRRRRRAVLRKQRSCRSSGRPQMRAFGVLSRRFGGCGRAYGCMGSNAIYSGHRWCLPRHLLEQHTRLAWGRASLVTAFHSRTRSSDAGARLGWCASRCACARATRTPTHAPACERAAASCEVAMSCDGTEAAACD